MRFEREQLCFVWKWVGSRTISLYQWPNPFTGLVIWESWRIPGHRRFGPLSMLVGINDLESSEYFIFKDCDRVPQSRIIVVKLNTSTLKDAYFFRNRLESEEARLPVSWGEWVVLRLLSHQLSWKRLAGSQSSCCPLLVWTTPMDFICRRVRVDILLLADSRWSFHK